ncbi:MAG TPA: IMPACT family protein, partial [Anaerovibrio sp.]|nr:IMPACT family protein [Anaerovibrio sp.]
NNLRSGETEYTDKVTVKLLIEPDDVENIQSSLVDLTAGRCDINVAAPEYLAIQVKK